MTWYEMRARILNVLVSGGMTVPQAEIAIVGIMKAFDAWLTENKGGEVA